MECAWSTVYLLLTWSCFTKISAVFEIKDWSSKCIPGCVCSLVDRSVTCHSVAKLNISLLATPVSNSVRDIHVENSSFKNGKLSINLLKFPSLQTLSLERNNLTNVAITTNYENHNLKSLLLPNNKLESFDIFKKVQLSNLKKLDLSANRLKNLTPKYLHFTPNLMILHLENNYIERLPLGVFNRTEYLEELYLGNNNLNYIHPNLFTSSPKLKHIHLQNNFLSTLKNGTWDGLMNLNDLHLEGNPFICSCALRWLVQDMLSDSNGGKYANKNQTKCHAPDAYMMSPMYKLNLNDFSCTKPSILSTSGDTTVLYLNDIVLHCNVTGFPKPAVYWVTPRGHYLTHSSHHRWINHKLHDSLIEFVSFKSQPTHTDSKAFVASDGSLHVKRMRKYFSGQYLCVAENPEGAVSMNVSIRVTTLMPQIFLTTLWIGASVAGGFLLFGIVFGLLRWCLEVVVCNEKKPKEPKKASIEDSVASSTHSLPYTPSYTPSPSSMRCVTPISMDSDNSDANFSNNIKETLEDVRLRLRSGMEKQVGRIRSRAQHVRQAGSQYVQTIKDSGNQYMQSIKESSSHYAQTFRLSTGHYAHRVRVGMQVGVEQVKYHVQSMKELCGTGDLNQTVSTVSMSTDVDTQEKTQVIKNITIV